jgi:hypothetical protein
MYEYSVLRRIFGPEKEKVTEDGENYNNELHNL